MFPRPALNRDAQFGHMREVGRTQPSWLMLLAEVDLLRRPFRGTPQLDASLQCPELPLLKPARVFSLQPLE
jgi:hypothetical protein